MVQTDNTVDFSVTSAAPTIYGTSRDGKLLGTTWAARWTGLVLPSQSEVYTFYAGGDVSNSARKERVKVFFLSSVRLLPGTWIMCYYVARVLVRMTQHGMLT